MGGRRDGKPFLRLLECYVLARSARSPPRTKPTFEMEPKLSRICGTHGGWREAITAATGVPAGMPEAIRERRDRNVEVAESRGERIDPQAFADAVAGQYSGPSLGRSA